MKVFNTIENAYLYTYVPSQNENTGGIVCCEGTIEQIRHENSIKKWRSRFTDPTGKIIFAPLNLRYGQGEISWLMNPETNETVYHLWLSERDDEEAKMQFDHCFRFRVSLWANILDDFRNISKNAVVNVKEETENA